MQKKSHCNGNSALGKAVTCVDFVLISVQCDLLWTNMEGLSPDQSSQWSPMPLGNVTLPQENTDLSVCLKNQDTELWVPLEMFNFVLHYSTLKWIILYKSTLIMY